MHTMITTAKRFALAAAFVALGAGIGVAEEAPAAGPSPSAEASPAAPVAPAALTAQDVEAFFDGFVPYAIERGDIPGGVVSVVKDGQLLFAKGYGLADIATRKPVTPDATLFRPGSVSKLFTWTAVMQQVEQGKLDLDADVNIYLDFKIPEAFGAPITLRNIMTHTAGFEEVIRDLIVLDAKDSIPLGDYLKTHIPTRIFPPGKTVAYSNYATSLAGYIVERVSGETFEDYLANHIFKPLGMDRSTFAQPLPEALAPLMATGYKSAGEAKPVPFELVVSSPAGALSSTGTDMAKFMIAHLGDGGQGAARLLKPETLAAMHTRNYETAPNLNGFALGFYETSRNGHRVIAHAGDTTAFHSDLELVVDENVGIFMSFNAGGKTGDVQAVRTAVFRAFMDRYFPSPLPVDAPFDAAKHDARRVAGTYEASRRKDTAMLLLSLLGQATVTPEANGDIKVDFLKDYGGNPRLWRQIAPLRYREVGGQGQLVFIEDAKTGAIDYFTTDVFPPVEIFQRTPTMTASSFALPVIGIGIAVLALGLLVWLVGLFVRWRHGVTLEMTTGQFVLRLASRLGVVAILALVAGWLGFFVAISTDDSLLLGPKVTSALTMLYVLGAAGTIGCIAVVAHAGARVLSGPGGIVSRFGEALLGLAGLAGLWAIFAFGLANFVTAV